MKLRSVISFLKKLRAMHIPLHRYFCINCLPNVRHDSGRIFPSVEIELNCEGDGVFILHGDVRFGQDRFPAQKGNCKIYLGAGTKLLMDGGTIYNNCTIEVVDHGVLMIGPSFYANWGVTILCARSIKIGSDVNMGRDVIIRDTNGGHTVLRDGYECSREIVIGDHVWLCDRAEILPGVHIGDGSIVAAGAVVAKDVPAHSLVAGVPARVIRSGVNWK